MQATRDLDRGRTVPEAVDELRAKDLAELVEVQQAAGLELIADGMLAWQDLFRPLVEASEGLEPGALTRFLDTNSFYRAPQATDVQPKLAEPLDERYVAPLPGPRLVTLPSPFAFSKGTGIPPAVLAEGVLKPQLEALDAKLIVLSEPFLAHSELPEQELGDLSDALEKLAGPLTLVLQISFADVGPLLPRLAELAVDGIGVDFYATPIEAVPEGLDKLLLAGVVDARSSALEDPQELAAFARRLLEERGVRELALVPNGDLQFVPKRIAREKLERLGRAKTTVAKEAAA